jgi:hypothetical protein
MPSTNPQSQLPLAAQSRSATGSAPRLLHQPHASSYLVSHERNIRKAWYFLPSKRCGGRCPRARLFTAGLHVSAFVLLVANRLPDLIAVDQHVLTRLCALLYGVPVFGCTAREALQVRPGKAAPTSISTRTFDATEASGESPERCCTWTPAHTKSPGVYWPCGVGIALRLRKAKTTGNGLTVHCTADFAENPPNVGGDVQGRRKLGLLPHQLPLWRMPQATPERA